MPATMTDTPSQPLSPLPQLLSLDDAALRLAVRRRTVERLIAAGRLPSLTIGRRRLVTVTAIAQFVAESTDH
jgi:excisionase family DNA binding protein